jgi:hypothetical protein
MGVPEGSLAIAAFIILALPGFILAAVGRWARGESTADRDVGLTFARGTVFAVALTAVYLVVLAGHSMRDLSRGWARTPWSLQTRVSSGLPLLSYTSRSPLY